MSNPNVSDPRKLQASVNGRGFASCGYNWSFWILEVVQGPKSFLFLLYVQCSKLRKNNINYLLYQIVWEACNKNNKFPLVPWDSPLPWDPSPPKTRHKRPKGRLVLASLTLSYAAVTGQKGRVEGAPWAHHLKEVSGSWVQLFLMLWLLPSPETLCCVLCLSWGLSAVPIMVVWSSLPNGHGW